MPKMCFLKNWVILVFQAIYANNTEWNNAENRLANVKFMRSAISRLFRHAFLLDKRRWKCLIRIDGRVIMQSVCCLCVFYQFVSIAARKYSKTSWELALLSLEQNKIEENTVFSHMELHRRCFFAVKRYTWTRNKVPSEIRKRRRRSAKTFRVEKEFATPSKWIKKIHPATNCVFESERKFGLKSSTIRYDQQYFYPHWMNVTWMR